MFSRFDRIPACDRRTDRRTDILQQQIPRYAWHSAVKIIDFDDIRYKRADFELGDSHVTEYEIFKIV